MRSACSSLVRWSIENPCCDSLLHKSYNGLNSGETASEGDVDSMSSKNDSKANSIRQPPFDLFQLWFRFLSSPPARLRLPPKSYPSLHNIHSIVILHPDTWFCFTSNSVFYYSLTRPIPRPYQHRIHHVQSIHAKFAHRADRFVPIPAQPLHLHVFAPHRRRHVENLQLAAVQRFKIPQKRPGGSRVHRAAVHRELANRGREPLVVGSGDRVDHDLDVRGKRNRDGLGNSKNKPFFFLAFA